MARVVRTPRGIAVRLEAVEEALSQLGVLSELRNQVADHRELLPQVRETLDESGALLAKNRKALGRSEELLGEIASVSEALGQAEGLVGQIDALQQRYDTGLKPLEGTIDALHELRESGLADRLPELGAAMTAVADAEAEAEELTQATSALRERAKEASRRFGSALEAVADAEALAGEIEAVRSRVSSAADAIADAVARTRTQDEETRRALSDLRASDTTLMELQYQDAARLWVSVADQVRTITLGAFATASGGAPDLLARVGVVAEALRGLLDAYPNYPQGRADLVRKLDDIERLQQAAGDAPRFDAHGLSPPRVYALEYEEALVQSALHTVDPAGDPDDEADNISTVGYRPMLARDGAAALAAYVAELHRWIGESNMADWQRSASREMMDSARVVIRLECGWFHDGREPQPSGEFSTLAEQALDGAGLERIPIAIGDRASPIDHDIASSDADPHETDLEVASIRMHGLREKANPGSIVMKPRVTVTARGTRAE